MTGWLHDTSACERCRLGRDRQRRQRWGWTLPWLAAAVTVAVVALLLSSCGGGSGQTYGGGFDTKAHCLSGQLFVLDGRTTPYELAHICQTSYPAAETAYAKYWSTR